MTLRFPPPEPLVFDPARKPGDGLVGCVHVDGSITFEGRLYATLREVPASCTAFRADLPSTLQWRRLYRATTAGRPSWGDVSRGKLPRG